MVPIYSDITDNINGQTVCTSHDQSSEVADMRSDGLLQKHKSVIINLTRQSMTSADGMSALKRFTGAGGTWTLNTSQMHL